MEKAAEYFEKAANLGFELAQVIVEVIFDTRNLVPGNEVAIHGAVIVESSLISYILGSIPTLDP